ncbi:hypothetical protein ACFLTD_02145, partial [Elusimicrobiota bacterium]
MKLLKSFYIKIISMFLAASFIFVYVLGDYAYATKYAQVKEDIRYSQKIDVPLPLGKVIDRYDSGSGDTRVIMIQDLHANVQTQENIKAILEHIDTNYGISRIGVEGSSGKVDTSIISSIPDPDVRDEITGYFMGKGMITGAEGYAIYRDMPVLQGLEDSLLYEKNSRLLLGSLNRRNEFVGTLERIKYLLRVSEDRICSKDLKNFRSKYILYRQKQIDPHIFHKYIRDYAKKCSVTVAHVSPEYARFMELNRMYASLDFPRIEKEYDRLLKELDLKYDGEDDLQSLIKKFKNFFKVPEEIRGQMIQAVYTQADYGNLRNYFECVELSKRINSSAVIEQEDKLINNISRGLCKNQSEESFVYVSDYIQLLVKFLLNQMTPADLDAFYNNTEEFLSRFNELSDQCSEEMEGIDTLLSSLKPYIEEMGAFYNIALERDEYFINNFLGKEQVILSGNTIMVTGGFHTYGMARLLKERGISYVTIKPTVTRHNDEDRERYYSFIRDTKLLSYEDVVSLTLAPKSFFMRQWFRDRAAVSTIAGMIRRELAAAGYAEYAYRSSADKLKDFLREWGKGYVKISADAQGFDFKLLKSHVYDSFPVYELEIRNEHLMLGIDSKTKKPVVVPQEKAVQIREELKISDAVRRLEKLNEYLKTNDLPIDQTDEITQVLIAGSIRPVVSIGRLSADQAKKLQDWLKGYDHNTRMVESEGEYYIFDADGLRQALKTSSIFDRDKEAWQIDPGYYLRKFILNDQQKKESILKGKPIIIEGADFGVKVLSPETLSRLDTAMGDPDKAREYVKEDPKLLKLLKKTGSLLASPVKIIKAVFSYSTYRKLLGKKTLMSVLFAVISFHLILFPFAKGRLNPLGAEMLDKSAIEHQTKEMLSYDKYTFIARRIMYAENLDRGTAMEDKNGILRKLDEKYRTMRATVSRAEIEKILADAKVTNKEIETAGALPDTAAGSETMSVEETIDKYIKMFFVNGDTEDQDLVFADNFQQLLEKPALGQLEKDKRDELGKSTLDPQTAKKLKDVWYKYLQEKNAVSDERENIIKLISVFHSRLALNLLTRYLEETADDDFRIKILQSAVPNAVVNFKLVVADDTVIDQETVDRLIKHLKFTIDQVINGKNQYAQEFFGLMQIMHWMRDRFDVLESMTNIVTEMKFGESENPVLNAVVGSASDLLYQSLLLTDEQVDRLIKTAKEATNETSFLSAVYTLSGRKRALPFIKELMGKYSSLEKPKEEDKKEDKKEDKDKKKKEVKKEEKVEDTRSRHLMVLFALSRMAGAGDIHSKDFADIDEGTGLPTEKYSIVDILMDHIRKEKVRLPFNYKIGNSVIYEREINNAHMLGRLVSMGVVEENADIINALPKNFSTWMLSEEGSSIKKYRKIMMERVNEDSVTKIIEKEPMKWMVEDGALLHVIRGLTDSGEFSPRHALLILNPQSSEPEEGEKAEEAKEAKKPEDNPLFELAQHMIDSIGPWQSAIIGLETLEKKIEQGEKEFTTASFLEEWMRLHVMPKWNKADESNLYEIPPIALAWIGDIAGRILIRAQLSELGVGTPEERAVLNRLISYRLNYVPLKEIQAYGPFAAIVLNEGKRSGDILMAIDLMTDPVSMIENFYTLRHEVLHWLGGISQFQKGIFDIQLYGVSLRQHYDAIYRITSDKNERKDMKYMISKILEKRGPLMYADYDKFVDGLAGEIIEEWMPFGTTGMTRDGKEALKGASKEELTAFIEGVLVGEREKYKSIREGFIMSMGKHYVLPKDVEEWTSKQIFDKMKSDMTVEYLKWDSPSGMFKDWFVYNYKNALRVMGFFNRLVSQIDYLESGYLFRSYVAQDTPFEKSMFNVIAVGLFMNGDNMDYRDNLIKQISGMDDPDNLTMELIQLELYEGIKKLAGAQEVDEHITFEEALDKARKLLDEYKKSIEAPERQEQVRESIKPHQEAGKMPRFTFGLEKILIPKMSLKRMDGDRVLKVLSSVPLVLDIEGKSPSQEITVPSQFDLKNRISVKRVIAPDTTLGEKNVLIKIILKLYRKTGTILPGKLPVLIKKRNMERTEYLDIPETVVKPVIKGDPAKAEYKGLATSFIRPISDLFYGWMAVMGVLVLIIAGMFVNRYRKRTKYSDSDHIKLEDVSETALEKIRELKQILKDKLQKDPDVDVGKYYRELNKTFTDFIIRHFGLTRGRRSSEELIKEIKTLNILSRDPRERLEQRRKITAILKNSADTAYHDLVPGTIVVDLEYAEELIMEFKKIGILEIKERPRPLKGTTRLMQLFIVAAGTLGLSIAGNTADKAVSAPQLDIFDKIGAYFADGYHGFMGLFEAGRFFTDPQYMWFIGLVLIVTVIHLLRRPHAHKVPSTDMYPKKYFPRWRKYTVMIPVLLTAVSLLLAVITAAGPGNAVSQPMHTEKVLKIGAGIDRSGSMDTKDEDKIGEISRYDQVKDILAGFALKLRWTRHLFCLVKFGDYSIVEVPFTHSKRAFVDILNMKEALDSSTAVGDGGADIILELWHYAINKHRKVPEYIKDMTDERGGISRARDILSGEERGLEGERKGAYKKIYKEIEKSLDGAIMVLLSDFQHNSGRLKPAAVIAAAKALGIRIYTIGATYSEDGISDKGLNFSLMRQMAEETGGKWYIGKDKDTIEKALDDILKTETQYETIYKTVFNSLKWATALLALVFESLANAVRMFAGMRAYAARPSSSFIVTVLLAFMVTMGGLLGNPLLLFAADEEKTAVSMQDQEEGELKGFNLKIYFIKKIKELETGNMFYRQGEEKLAEAERERDEESAKRARSAAHERFSKALTAYMLANYNHPDLAEPVMNMAAARVMLSRLEKDDKELHGAIAEFKKAADIVLEDHIMKIRGLGEAMDAWTDNMLGVTAEMDAETTKRVSRMLDDWVKVSVKVIKDYSHAAQEAAYKYEGDKEKLDIKIQRLEKDLEENLKKQDNILKEMDVSELGRRQAKLLVDHMNLIELLSSASYNQATAMLKIFNDEKDKKKKQKLFDEISGLLAQAVEDNKLNMDAIH